MFTEVHFEECNIWEDEGICTCRLDARWRRLVFLEKIPIGNFPSTDRGREALKIHADQYRVQFQTVHGRGE